MILNIIKFIVSNDFSELLLSSVIMFCQKIDQTLDSFEVPQPEELQQSTQTQEKCSVQGQHHSSNSLYNVTTPLNQPPIFKMAFGSSIIRFFPSQFSHYTLY